MGFTPDLPPAQGEIALLLSSFQHANALDTLSSLNIAYRRGLEGQLLHAVLATGPRPRYHVAALVLTEGSRTPGGPIFRHFRQGLYYAQICGRWIGQREVARLLEAVEPRYGGSLLDVGCGTGYFTLSLSGAFSGRVLGIDINPDWIEYARYRLWSGGSSTCTRR